MLPDHADEPEGAGKYGKASGDKVKAWPLETSSEEEDERNKVYTDTYYKNGWGDVMVADIIHEVDDVEGVLCGDIYD